MEVNARLIGTLQLGQHGGTERRAFWNYRKRERQGRGPMSTGCFQKLQNIVVVDIDRDHVFLVGMADENTSHHLLSNKAVSRYGQALLERLGSDGTVKGPRQGKVGLHTDHARLLLETNEVAGLLRCRRVAIRPAGEEPQARDPDRPRQGQMTRNRTLPLRYGRCTDAA